MSIVNIISFPLSIMFLLITISMIIIGTIYLFFWKPKLPSISCSSNTQCVLNQVCSGGVCDQQLCSSNKDCALNGLCINSYCTSFNRIICVNVDKTILL